MPEVSAYVIQKTESSYCPKCNETVSLLCHKDCAYGPSFYICNKCGFVAEVGVGIVEDVTNKDE